MIQVRIASLAVDPRTNQPVLILRPLDEEPGTAECSPSGSASPRQPRSCSRSRASSCRARSRTTCMKSVLESLGAYVERIEITRVEEGTFFAAIILRAEERTIAVDARPSDSIALAVRTGAPIFVAEDVMESAAVPDDSGEIVDEEAELEAFREFLDSRRPRGLPGLSGVLGS